MAVRQYELGLRVVLDEVLEVLRDRRQAAPGMDQDRHAPFRREPEHRIELALAEIEFLGPGVELDPPRPGRGSGRLGDRLGGQVEPAEGDERAVRRRGPLQDAVVGDPVGREAVGIVQGEREAALNTMPPHRMRSSSGVCAKPSSSTPRCVCASQTRMSSGNVERIRLKCSVRRRSNPGVGTPEHYQRSGDSLSA